MKQEKKVKRFFMSKKFQRNFFGKVILMVVLIVSVLLIVGCSQKAAEDVNAEDVATEESDEFEGRSSVTSGAVVDVEGGEEVEGEGRKNTNGSCMDTIDCELGDLCIDGNCGTVPELYNTDCEIKCNFDSVVVETSDGDVYDLKRGEGSYTAAGALAWTLLSGPDYCQGEEIIVPIKLEKINYSKVLNRNVVTVKAGETSEVITHPLMERVAFTLTITSVEEECFE